MKLLNIKTASACILIIMAIFGYGIAVGKSHIFPYKQAKFVYHKITGKSDAVDTELGVNYNDRLAHFKKFNSNTQIVMLGDSITERGEWGGSA